MYSNDNNRRVGIIAGQLRRFVCQVKVGDYVIFPSKINREINIGVVEGGYTHNADNSAVYVNQHKVKWLKSLPRTAFSQGALMELGCGMTLFMITKYSDEFLAVLEKNSDTVLTDEEDDTVALNCK